MLKFIKKAFKPKLKFYYCNAEVILNENKTITTVRTFFLKKCENINDKLLNNLLNKYPTSTILILSCVEISEHTFYRISELNKITNFCE